MKLPGPPLPHCRLSPGDLLITSEPQWVLTLLGSCVAVTMFNARACRAAICHAMLPEPRHRTSHCTTQDECFRYVSHAIPNMASHFFDLGLMPHEIEVKMFGGGNVIDLGDAPHGQQEIGSANVLMAREVIAALRLQVKAERVGGNSGCKIIFNTQTGQVLHKHLRKGDRGK